jgi:ribosome maturation factor RimP
MQLPQEIENLKGEIKAEVEKFGAELVDITSRKSGSKGILTLLVDKSGGVTLEDCVNINNSLSRFLDNCSDGLSDQSSFIKGSYFLEVNSPGLDRPLKTQRDFEWATGFWVRFHWRAPEGRNVFCVAKVLAAGARSVRLETKDRGVLEVDFEQIVSAVREIEFSHRGQT